MLNAGLRRWQAERREADAEGTRLLAGRQPTLAQLRARDKQREARQAAVSRAGVAARRAAKLQRTPPWANREAIVQLHLEARRLTHETGAPHHVDHVLPLQGRLVSGLHVHTNMCVIPARDNVRKGNRFSP